VDVGPAPAVAGGLEPAALYTTDLVEGADWSGAAWAERAVGTDDAKVKVIGRAEAKGTFAIAALEVDEFKTGEASVLVGATDTDDVRVGVKVDVEVEETAASRLSLEVRWNDVDVDVLVSVDDASCKRASVGAEVEDVEAEVVVNELGDVVVVVVNRLPLRVDDVERVLESTELAKEVDARVMVEDSDVSVEDKAVALDDPLESSLRAALVGEGVDDASELKSAFLVVD
jgi:hypothetical protein